MNKRSNNAWSIRILLFALLLTAACNKAYGQFYSAKVDILGLATGTFNIEGSMLIDRHWSAHLPVLYNPWTFPDNKKMKNITVLPGVRYWMRETYSGGCFFGANAIITRYNFGGLLGSNYRYDGMGYGLGLSAGYAIPFKKRWNIEFELGAGVIWSEWDKYSCRRCGEKIEEESGFRLIPDKIAVCIVYLF